MTRPIDSPYEIPGIPEPWAEALAVVCRVARELGLTDPFRYVAQIELVDTDRLRQVGTQVWGADGVRSVAAEALRLVTEGLDNQAGRLGERWTGEGVQAFHRSVDLVREAVTEEADRFQVVGSCLVEVADAIEFSKVEIWGLTMAAAGVLATVASLLWAPGVGGVAARTMSALTGLVLTSLDTLQAIMSLVQPRLEAVREATSRLPDRSDGSLPAPGDPGGGEWRVRSGDLYS